MDKINYSKNIWEGEDLQTSKGDNSELCLHIQRKNIVRRGQSRKGSYLHQDKRNIHRSLNIGGGLFCRRNATKGGLRDEDSSPQQGGQSAPKVRSTWYWGSVSLLGAAFFVAWLSGFLSYPSAAREDTNPVFEELTERPVSPETVWQDWKQGLSTTTSYLQKNEALVYMLKRYGLSQQDSSDLVLSIREEIDLTRLRAEDPITLYFSSEEEEGYKQLVGFQIGEKELTVNSYLYQGEPKNEIQYHELYSKIFHSAVVVNRSLYQDGADQGVPGAILLEMFNNYSFDINFQSDIQQGTRYELVYTMEYNENEEEVGTGDILYSNIILTNGRTYPIFEYTDLEGNSEFYNPQGRSVNKALLLIPVNGAYISSTFGYRRDPVYGSWRLHRGTDYAARTGTPIKAGGMGVIITRGWSRVGYGQHIIIRHNNGYDTVYGHMSRFRPGLRVGSKVRQGDIIGYVGSTGKSTGPHVHYEVRRYGKPVDIRSLNLQSSQNLAGVNLDLFTNSIEALQARFRGILPDLDQMNVPLDLVQRSEKIRRNGIGGANFSSTTY